MTEAFKLTLTNNGYRVTAPRTRIFEFLRLHDPTTISDLIAAHEHIDKASVYRCVTLFHELKIIQEIIIGGKRMIELTDSFDSHHHHFTCLTCGKTRSVEDENLEQRLNKLAEMNNFEPHNHQIEVSGLCRSCRSKG